jgi:hypothetical protein
MCNKAGKRLTKLRTANSQSMLFSSQGRDKEEKFIENFDENI